MADESESTRRAQSRGYHTGSVDTVISVDDVQRQAEKIARSDLTVAELVLGDHLHIPHDPPIVSEKIEITVE